VKGGGLLGMWVRSPPPLPKLFILNGMPFDLTTIGPNSWRTVRCVLNDSQQHLAAHFLQRVHRFPALPVRLSAAVASVA
jgi:hypothetical protein